MNITLSAYNLELDGPAVDITLTPAEFEDLIKTIDMARDLIPAGKTDDALRRLYNELEGSAARQRLEAWNTQRRRDE